MPLYEYRCDACEHEFERLIRGGDSEPDTCPECDESAVSRLISNTSFQLKGSGWYETDYARDDEPGSEESGAEEGAESGDAAADAEAGETDAADAASDESTSSSEAPADGGSGESSKATPAEA